MSSPDPVSRARLRQWLAAHHFAGERLEPLAGDVSPRRYTRVSLIGGGSAILAYYPPSIRETSKRFLATTRLLEEHDVPVPRILALEAAEGLMLLEDAGSETLFDRPMSWQQRLPLLRRAGRISRQIGALPAARVEEINPAFDRTLFDRELELTWRSFVEPNRRLPAALSQRLRELLERLCDLLLVAPQRPCHRDLMARNLLLSNDRRELVVLDHQDLRLGPCGYDLASLLNDSLYPPADVVEELLGELLDGEEERLAYHRAAAQRTFKILGTFSRFGELGSRRYLPLIEPTLARFVEHLARLPEAEGIATELGETFDPGRVTPGGR